MGNLCSDETKIDGESIKEMTGKMRNGTRAPVDNLGTSTGPAELPECSDKVKQALSKRQNLSSVYRTNEMKKNNVNNEQGLLIPVGVRFDDSVFVGEVYFKDQFAHEEYKKNGNILKPELVTFGFGTQVWKDGSYYEGAYLNAKFNGMGRYVHSSGDLYEGNFVDSLAKGRGQFFGFNGDTYDGEFSNNQYNGKGVFKNKHREVYEGHFVDSKKQGEGVLTVPGKHEYAGYFVANVYNGQGCLNWTDGTNRSYEGNFSDGKFNGKGRYTYENGNVFNGIYRNGVRHGHGKLIMAKKLMIFECTWENGQENGKGAMYGLNNNKELMVGDWKDGKLVETHVSND